MENEFKYLSDREGHGCHLAEKFLKKYCSYPELSGYFTLIEVKEGYPDFLQITFFLNAVLFLYLKLFTCLEIITMLK